MKSIDIKKWNPWNWFRHEGEEKARSLPVQRNAQGAAGSAASSLFPHDALWNMHREVDRLFDNVFSHFHMPRLWDGGAESMLLKPNVDIKETKKRYEITVEVPGVSEDDVKLELSGGALTVSGEKKHEKAEEDEGY